MRSKVLVVVFTVLPLLSLTILISLITVIPAVYSQEPNIEKQLDNARNFVSNIQPETSNSYHNVTMPPVDFSKLFSENKEFQSCDTPTNFGSGGCSPVVDVLYQDGSTVALKSDAIDLIWRAVAEVKKNGYTIDALTSYPISKPEGGGTNVNILVVMSR